MVKSLEQIKQELEKIESEVRELGHQLYQAYNAYLESLTQATQKQLISATYQICTQIYPSGFLNLSVFDRTQLQKEIRQLSDGLYHRYLACLQPHTVESDLQPAPSTDSLMDQLMKKLPQIQEAIEQQIKKQISQGKPLEGRIEIIESLPSFSIDDEEEKEEKEEEDQEEEEETINYTHPIEMSDPNDLLEWAEDAESAVDRILENLSKEINELFKKNNIFPQPLPSKMLDMALQNAGGAEVMSGPPNLIHILLEIDSDREKKGESEMIKITVIRLHLTEIEFSSPSVSIARSTLKNLLGKINGTCQQYNKKQKEKSIASAELAWRSTWGH